MKISYTRILDVFLLGPLKLYLINFVKDINLKIILFIIGILTIIFNAHNFFIYDFKYLKQPWAIFEPFIKKKTGKTQYVRLLNLLIMYPILIYINLNFELPDTVKLLLNLNNLLGFLYNLMNFIFVYMIESNNKKYQKYINFYNKYLFF